MSAQEGPQRPPDAVSDPQRGDCRTRTPEAVSEPSEAVAPHDGPTVAECRDADRAHWDDKYDQPRS
ncbi:hypothetical protein [Streptomyces himalayensis]|uniref:Uncharacterized protein n=1 Tax=Streptomyces himalayensis subsp. himalayensis TaxID=2756131 RepID=A0A7W0DUQ6_9ACTN|nr:hypothetical protein [Streptomyces himalayensis]MBA2951622.1 hypothetical protein [Streptomyces himalayensis subsp. himalayensis]